ncbi:hypothetical protein [Brevibacillus parabrevis]
MLPERSGWEIFQYFREKSDCPVFILTAVGQTEQIMNGLIQGADDFISIAFVAEVLVAGV